MAISSNYITKGNCLKHNSQLFQINQKVTEKFEIHMYRIGIYIYIYIYIENEQVILENILSRRKKKNYLCGVIYQRQK